MLTMMAWCLIIKTTFVRRDDTWRSILRGLVGSWQLNEQWFCEMLRSRFPGLWIDRSSKDTSASFAAVFYTIQQTQSCVKYDSSTVFWPLFHEHNGQKLTRASSYTPSYNEPTFLIDKSYQCRSLRTWTCCSKFDDNW